MKVRISLRLLLAMVLPMTAAEAKVVINEIFYHAPNDVDDLQWIELHNTGSEPVDVSGWSFTKGVRFSFSKGSQIGAGGFTVVCQNNARFQKYYGFAAAGEFEKSLRRKGERVELSDAKGAVVDMLKFDDRAPWPVSPAGFSASMERISPDAMSALPENWSASPLKDNPDEPSGTPGKTNASYSANLPPVVTHPKFTPTSPKAAEPVEVDVEVEDADGVKEVVLLYRVIEPGKEGPEQSVVLTARDRYRFSGSIPGQAAERLVRFRIRADDRLGTRRYYPGPNEPRPAFSYWVPGELPATKLAVARLVHVDPQDFARAQRQRAAGGRAGFNEDDMLRWNIQRTIRSTVDPAVLWVALALKHGSTAEQRASWRPLFARLTADRDALIAQRQASNDLQAALQGSVAGAVGLKSEFKKVLAPLVSGPQVEELNRWVAGARPGGGGLRMRGEMMLSQALRLEPPFQALTLREDLTAEQFAAVQAAYLESQKQREELVDVAAAVRDAESYEKLNEKVTSVTDAVQSRLKPALKPDQLVAMDKAAEEDRATFSFGAGRGRSTLSSVVQGHSALVWYEAGSREPRVFDFISIADRKAGYKVRLQRDRPLNGMTGLNLIFEENERMVMAEPLALQFYRAAGMPASLTDFVEVILDNAPLGYHLMIEQPNSAFVRRNGIADGGDMFKYLWFERGIAAQHEKKNNPHRTHEELLRLIDQLEKTQGAEQWQLIRKEFDVEEVINYFVVNMLLSHWDGFMNNYFVYHDFRETGKWMMFPWDQDKTWGVYDGIPENTVFATLPLTYGVKGDLPPGWTKDRPPKSFFETINTPGSEWWRPPGYFSGPLLANPDFRRQYLARIKELLETQFTEENLFPQFERLKGQLADAVRHRARLRQEDEAASTALFDRNLDSFRQFVRERRKYLLAQPELKRAGAFDRTQLK